MSLINFYEINTITGYKSIELHNADLLKFDKEIDCLVVSASIGDYLHTKRSLVGGLFREFGIDLNLLSQDPEIDLRNSLNVWISKKINGKYFKRIVCVEIANHNSSSLDIETPIKNLFSLLSILDNNDVELNSIAMPLIGSGNQKIPPSEVLPVLLRHTEKALNRIIQLNKIYLVERTETKVSQFDEAMNKYLKRNTAETQFIPDKEIYKNTVCELIINLKKVNYQINKNMNIANNAISELLFKLEKGEIRFFELSILSRRLVEMIVSDILEVKELRFELWKSIDLLSNKNIAPWIVSYLHILRTFGNSSAHEKDQTLAIPSKVNEKDMLMILFIINRVLDFWLLYRAK